MRSPPVLPKDQSLPILPWPKLIWRAEMWLTLIPFVLSFILFFYPELGEANPSDQVRVILGVSLFLAPILAPMLLWVWKATRVVALRSHFYPDLYQQVQSADNEIVQLRKNFFEVATHLSSNRVFEITRAGHYEGKLYLILPKRRGYKIDKGDTFIVVHNEDGLLMGVFQISEVRGKELYAIGVSNIDPVWSGYIRQHGEVGITPNLVAIYIPQGDTE